MGILELIKLRRVIITTVKVFEDVVEYEERGLDMMFKLNPDYVPGESSESEFDSLPSAENDKKEMTENE